MTDSQAAPTKQRQRASRSPRRSTRKAWSITAVGALAAAASLGPAPAAALDVQPPPEWIQCRPATVNFQSQGNVSVVIRLPKANSRKMDTHSISRLGVGATSWTWPAVDLLAGTDFVLSMHDDQPWNSSTRSNKDVAELGRFIGNGTVTLPEGYANDTSCIKPKSSKKKSRGRTEIAVIAGVLGGVLLALLGMLAIVVWRRRREAKAMEGRESWLDHGPSTAAGGDGSSTNQANGGSAGWKYMSRLVPGLSPAAPGSHVPGAPAGGEAAAIGAGAAGQQGGGRRGRRARRNRTERNDDFDPELPSYGHSQSDAKLLPKYANGVGPHEAAPAEAYDLPVMTHRQGDLSIDVVDEDEDRHFNQYHQQWDQRGSVTRAVTTDVGQTNFSPPSFADPRARRHPHDVFADPVLPHQAGGTMGGDRMRQETPYGAWQDTGIAESQVNLVGGAGADAHAHGHMTNRLNAGYGYGGSNAGQGYGR